MFRTMLAWLFIFSVTQLASSVPADEVSEALARAEALYYQAEFNKSIELLLRVDELLKPQPDHLQEKISVKLQLGLAYIGLNDNAQAKVYFRELYALDQNYAVDPQQFSPKVVSLAEQAKTEQNEMRCQTLSNDAAQQLAAGNGDEVLKLIGTSQRRCAGLAPIATSAAELLVKDGIEAFRKTQMIDALQKFRAARQLDPTQELAKQYIELTENKLQLDAERMLLAWRKDFDAGEFAAAAKDYRQLLSLSSADTVNNVRTEYRKTLSGLVESWNRACATHDAATMEQIRKQMDQLLPEPSIGEDILAKMTNCTNTGCIQMNSQLVLARLKTRVDPEFPQAVLAQLKLAPVTVRIKARISETGEPTASELQGGNPMLYNPIRAAFERWRFTPAVIQGEARCVDTEIPISITLKAN